jgi:hypothetical protein
MGLLHFHVMGVDARTIVLALLIIAMFVVFVHMMRLMFPSRDHTYDGEYDDDGYMTGEGTLVVSR